MVFRWYKQQVSIYLKRSCSAGTHNRSASIKNGGFPLVQTTGQHLFKTVLFRWYTQQICIYLKRCCPDGTNNRSASIQTGAVPLVQTTDRHVCKTVVFRWYTQQVSMYVKRWCSSVWVCLNWAVCFSLFLNYVTREEKYCRKPIVLKVILSEPHQ